MSGTTEPRPDATAQSQPATPLQFESLQADQRQAILNAAAQWVRQAVQRQPLTAANEAVGDLAQSVVMGAFVTLKRGDLLRGCCGALGKPMLLPDAVRQAARKTALEDRRMAAIALCELPYLSLQVTLLGQFRRVTAQGRERIKAVRVGRHGLMIQRGPNSGLLLPSVATERGWDAEQFLQAVCTKAHLPMSAWEAADTDLYVFDGYSISGMLSDYLPKDLPDHLPLPLTIDQVAEYARLAGQNIVAMATGATPSYVIPHLPDVTANAIVLSMQWQQQAEGDQRQANAVQVSIRPGLPLQSTLYQMCQQSAAMFRQQGFSGELKVGLTVGFEPCMHGFGQRADLRGVDTTHRAIIVADANHCGFAFDASLSAAKLLETLRQRLPIGTRDATVYSVHVATTTPRLISISGPSPVSHQGVRPPAVAGKFYPAEDAARREQVKQLLKAPEPPKLNPLAVMVPHAGLKYSGRIAAAVWRRIEDLDGRTLIIIGPKHTRRGVNWAVCPCTAWRISPATSFDNDIELAQRLAVGVTPLELDAAAHAEEHGIEVQLPILEQLGPHCKVVGAALAGASWPDIQAAAEEMAEVLRGLSPRPLLVISSDMNHYAPYEENRRRDRLALDALATGDPKRLIDVCQQNEISMCGVVPAALVMETLHRLDQPFEVVEVDYTTSGDVTGQRGEVVGYAGAMLVPTA